MREIKFRGRDMLYNWHIGTLSADGRHIIQIHRTEDGTERECYQEVEPDTIGQYTGLTDRNGKEIYEGDIVRWDECVADATFQTLTYAVFYDEGRFWPLSDMWCIDYVDENWEIPKLDCKIVGNKFDNSELLES